MNGGAVDDPNPTADRRISENEPVGRPAEKRKQRKKAMAYGGGRGARARGR